MRIYVAGPMRGRVGYNWPAFDEAARVLRLAGHDVVNPAELDRRDGLTESTAVTRAEVEMLLRRDCRELAACGAIYLLPGWEASEGAQRELRAAVALGLRIIEEAKHEVAC
jgi:hypothetical protein